MTEGCNVPKGAEQPNNGGQYWQAQCLSSTYMYFNWDEFASQQRSLLENSIEIIY